MKIFYRVVTALIAVCIVPNMLYNTLIRLVYSAGKNFVESKLSLMKIIDLFGEGGLLHGVFDNLSGSGNGEALKSILPYAIASGVLLALALLVGLGIVVINIIKPMQKTTLILCGCGILLTLSAMIVFNKGFAAPILTGAVSISDLIGGGVMGMLVSLFSGVKALQMGTAAIMNIIIFIVIAVWTGAFVLTDLGNNE